MGNGFINFRDDDLGELVLLPSDLFWKSNHRFLAGEAFCAVNYLFFGDRSFLAEYFHMLGMTLAFGLITWAFIEALDQRVIHITDHSVRCAALPLCGSCIKYTPVPCKAHRGFMLVAAIFLVVCLLPFASPLRARSYNTEILGVLYNYSHPVIY
jgi:hypothetical protein